MSVLEAIDPTPFHLVEAGVRNSTSPNESFEIDSTTATRVFKCLWEYRFEAVKYFLGYGMTYVDSEGEEPVTKITRLMPQPYGDDLPGLFATKVTGIKGHKWEEYEFPETPADGSGRNIWHKAEFTVLYEQVPYSIVADADMVEVEGFPGEMQRYLEDAVDIQPSGEYLQLPGAVMRYIDPDSGPAHKKPVPFNTGKIVAQEIFHVVWHRVPENVWTPESNLYNRIYSGEKDELGDTYVPFFGAINRNKFLGRPKGTVLLNNIIPRRRKSPLGYGYEWDISYEFAYKPSGWNWLYYFNPGTANATTGVITGQGEGNGWYFVNAFDDTQYTADVLPDNRSIYNARDFALLFSPADPLFP